MIKSPFYKRIRKPIGVQSILNESLRTLDEIVVLYHALVAKIQTVDDALDLVQKIQKGDKGEKGDKGDSLSEDDIQALVTDIESRIRIPEDGVTPIGGIDFPTHEEVERMVRDEVAKIPIPKDGKDAVVDYEAIVKKVVSLIPKPSDGLTPIKGVDYYTESDKKDLVKDILKDIPKGQEPEQIVELIKKKKLLKPQDVEGLDQTISAFRNQLARKGGYLHGGGDTLVAGTGVTLTTNANGTKTVSFSGMSSVILTATGTIDDSNVTFTFTAEPSVIVINGAFYFPTGGAITWTYLAGTVTLSVPVGTNGSIFGIR